MQTKTSIDALAWLAGDWQGEWDGGFIEEVWSAPTQENMIGMFRHLKDGRVKFYEFLVIEPEEDGHLLNMRHFSPGSLAWEEKDAPMQWTISDTGGDFIRFDKIAESTPVHMTYSRTEPDALVVVLVKEEPGGPEKHEFRYRRVSQSTRTDLAEQIAELFRQAKQAHQEAFIETGGADPDWPLWYANYVNKRLGALLGRNILLQELAGLLVDLNKDMQGKASGEDWPVYYARAVIERFQSS